MSIRLRRLQADFELISRLFAEHPGIKLRRHAGNPPEKYEFDMFVRGLEKEGGEVRTKDSHCVEIMLPRNYPREAPLCRMLTRVFHPNIAPHSICIGDHWAAGESLADLIVRIGEMIAFQSYNVKSPLNAEAAQWADENRDRLPISNADLSYDRVLLDAPDTGRQSSAPPRPAGKDRQSQAHASRPAIADGSPDKLPPNGPKASTARRGGPCPNCGESGAHVVVERCKHDHEVCGDCMMECQNCHERMCVLCSFSECRICGKLICAECTASCDECGKTSCVAHLRIANGGRQRLCPGCAKSKPVEASSLQTASPPPRERQVPTSRSIEPESLRVALTVANGPDHGKVFTFDQPKTLYVGRGGPKHPVDIRLSPDDPYVSRRHFRLEIAPPCVYLQDLQSVNPPFVNGIETIEVELKDGDSIQVGYSEFRVAIGREPSRIGVPSANANTVHCRGCGAELEVVAGAGPPDRCPFCSSRKAPAETPQRNRIGDSHGCSRCGKDCSALAQSDGRSRELADAVRYMCASCVEREMEGESLRVGPYEVLNTIGMGGMGIVYRVYHRPTGRIMALKQVLNLYANPETIRRFEREVHYTRELLHANILRFVDSGVAEEGPYLAMEYATEGNLEALMEKNDGPLAPPRAAGIVSACLDGLEFMHRMTVIHRDIKPENILLQRSADGALIPKLADFGLVKDYARAGGSRLTRLGARMGSLFFMPPEQFEDAGGVRESADTYAMGVTLYYLLTGEYPYDFPTPQKIRRTMSRQGLRSPDETVLFMAAQRKIAIPDIIVLTNEPVPVRQRIASIPSALAGVVDKAITKKQSERYGSAAAFRRDLRDAMGNA